MNVNKSLIIISLLLIFCISLGTVNAVDIDDKGNTIASITNLKEDNSDFTSLNEIIQNCAEGGEVNLNCNFTFLDSDATFKNGIVISKTITINGNNYTIDCSGLSRAFNITADNVVIKNLNINRGNFTDGSAIYWTGNYGILKDICLNDCVALNNGVVYWVGDNGLIDGFEVSQCDANQNGIVYWVGDNGTLTNAQFGYCEVHNDGIVYWVGDNGILSNAYLIDCPTNNGKVFWIGDNGTVINAVFTDTLLFVISDASGIYFNNTVKSTVDNCTFTSSTQINPGAGICCNNVTDLNVLRSIFMSSSGSYGGGIYCYNVSGSIKNSIFFNCYAAHGLGNSIYLNQSNVNYEDNLFNIRNTFTADDFKIGNFIYDDGAVVPNNVVVLNVRLTDKGYIVETVNNGTKDVVSMPDFKVQVEFNDSFGEVDLNVEQELEGKSVVAVYDFNSDFLAAPPFEYNITAYYDNGTYIIFIDTYQGIVASKVKGNFTIKVEDKVFIGELDEGSVSIPLTGLKPGNYTLDIYYSGDEYNLPFNTTFNIYKKNPDVVVEVYSDKSFDIKFGDTVVSVVTLPVDATGTVLFSIDNQTWDKVPITDDNHVFWNISGLDAGNYILFVKYSGDNKYNSSYSENPFTIEKLQTTVVVDSIKGKAGENVIISLRVTDDKGNPIPDGKITIKFNGKEYEAYVVEGIATVEVVLPSAGIYTATAFYEGFNYANSSALFTIEVSSNPEPNPTPFNNDVANMENTSNPLLVLLMALCVIGLGLFRREL